MESNAREAPAGRSRGAGGTQHRMFRSLAILAAMALWMVALAGPAWASHAFATVTNTNDSGEGSLRDAISLSNSWPTDTPKRIEFAIPQTDPGYDPTSGVVTISPTSPLPEIDYPVVIDGYSQPGAQANTLAVGNDAEIKVVLDGSRAGSAHGLQITEHAGSTVRGLAINRFSGSGIVLRGGGATGNKIEGNFVGTDASGGQDLGNGSYGVYLRYARRNTIGGTSPDARNVISGNGSHGVFVHDAFHHPTSNLVQGNHIGTDKGGRRALGNDLSGVYLLGVDGDVVGGTQQGAGNVISGNKGDGVAVVGVYRYYRSYARIEGNRIGTDASGGQDLGNGGNGVTISDSFNNVVGGAQQGAGNVISHNGGAGIKLEGWYSRENRVEANELSHNDGAGIRVGTPDFGGAPAANNALLANSTRANGGLGIDLAGGTENAYGVTENDAGDGGADAPGPNGLQNFPVLTSVEEPADGSFSVRGELDSLPDTGFAIEVFGNDESTGPDPSGHGEGRSFLGRVDVTTDASGHAAFSLRVDKLPGGTYAATATNKQAGAGTGETSELGPALPEKRPPPQCDDGEDNDGDGKTDSGGENPDPGCQDPSDNSENSDKTFTVDTTADGRDVGPGDGRCNTDVPDGSPCTLRAAIGEASATSAPDKVILPPGRYELAAASEGLVMNGDITLVGAGARSTTIAGGEGFTSSVLLPWYGASVEVSGVTISGGGGDYYGYSSQGGGIYNLGKLSLRESAVVGNRADTGGGIYSEGPLEIFESTIAGNVGVGAGVYQHGSPITVANSTISGNNGGGLIVGNDYSAGDAVLKMTNSTVASNTFDGPGGGVLTYGSATATIENSIIWGNGASDCDSAANGGGAITSAGGNVSGDASCGFTGADDQQNTDPLLGPLADNGGPTDTRRPDEGSPALDAGSATASCPATDQRGVTRPQEGDGLGPAACDAGAYELRFDGPTANNDSHEATQDGTLSVPAPGLLANDTDPEDDALSAVMVSDVSHGALALSADGSFTYTPAAGFVGRDAFTYKATDGASSSGVATVEILVKDAKPTVKGVAPTGRKVPRAANVTATFSEEMDADTVSTQTVNLTKKGARSPVQATVSYDPAAMKATLDPAKPLVKGATYTATVTTGAKDLAGNGLASAEVWKFTVRG